MSKELVVRLFNEETGKFETVTQNFIPLRKVIDWMKLDEEISASVMVPGAKDYMSGSEIFERRVKQIAELFDDKRVTYDSLLDGANAMDKLLLSVNKIVMDQYSDDEEEVTPGKD